MLVSYLRLAAAALIPAVATAFLCRLEKSKAAGRFSYAGKQILYGLIFGAIAVLGTELGIPLEGAVVNCRDAAPLCAGLYFGAPAGIIAGFIGGLERWFSVYWGVGAYTRLACSVSTALAGVLAALLRKHIFESKRPKLLLAAASAFIVETLHQSMVFFLHLDDAVTAAAVVRVTAPAMLPANTLSVLLAGVVYSFLNGRRSEEPQKRVSLSVLIERNLLISVVLSFLFTTAFAYRLQTGIAEKQAENTLRRELDGFASVLDGLTEAPDPNNLSALLSAYRTGSDAVLMMLTADGAVCASSDRSLPKETVPLRSADEDGLFTCSLYGEKYCAVRQDARGVSLAAALPAEEVYSVRNISALATCFVQVFIYGLLFAQISLMLRKRVVRSIHGINETLGRIASGNLGTKVEQRDSSEFSRLSDDINATVDTLKSYIEAEKEHNEQELRVARDIQLSALPRSFPAYPRRKDMDIYALTQPARQVGGDFYDFYFADNGHFYFLIADVSGKGVPAAMFMMRAKTQLKSLIEAGSSLEEAFSLGNSALCEGNDADMFVTAWMADVDMETGAAVFANAGHNPPAVTRKGGSFSLFKTRPGFVLGGMDGIRYKAETRQLAPGDRIVLYTDGVTEAANVENELFGEERLLRLLNENAGLSAAALGEEIRQEVLDFTGEAEQSDDITLLIFDYLGRDAKPEMRFSEAAAEDIPAATAFLENELKKLRCPEKIMLQMDVALDEVFGNIVQYAYPDGKGPVTLQLDADARSVTLTVIDEGVPYNPLERDDPDVTLPAEERTPGGLGIFLVKKTMDRVSYERAGRRNILRLTKDI